MTNSKIKVLIAGADGVLGKELVKGFLERGIETYGLGLSKPVMPPAKSGNTLSKFFCCDVTKPAQLRGVCDGIDMVISTIGITRINAKATHMDVDYQGNVNLLREAENAGVKKFVFISPAGVDKGHAYVPLFKAKYLFEEELKKSKIKWLIFRSGGFFRDLMELAKMAQKGSLCVIGKGTSKFTPIDVGELAEIMIEDSLCMDTRIVDVGGPDDMSWREICESCFTAFGKKPKLVYIPAWICKLASLLLKPFSAKYHAMSRLLIFTSLNDLPTARRGARGFKEYLCESSLLKTKNT